ncbi:MAG TPA: zf-HC2 domain-containing protein [Egibacteraceae bacterium]|nr:zf-HC2 domain-containing protein [Egibacteraceae bacterium]
MSSGCTDVESLHSAWVDGVLDPGEQARVAGHLRVCPACCAEIESLQRTRALVRSLPVRRLPADVGALRPPPAPVTLRAARTAPQGLAGAAHTARQRLVTGLAVVMALIGGAAFALGGQPSPDDRMVTVPVDLFVADHLVHTVGGPMSTPVVVEARQ